MTPLIGNNTLDLVLLVGSLLCFLAAGFMTPPPTPRVNLTAVGLALGVLSLLL